MLGSAVTAGNRFQQSEIESAKASQGQDVMQPCPCGSRKPSSFRKVAQGSRHHIEHQQPPRGFVAVVQPLGVDGTARHQPRDEDDQKHDDEERCREVGGGQQDNADKQSCAAEDEMRAPAFGSVGAPTGAEQEFEQTSMISRACRCAGKTGTQEYVAMKR